MDGYIVSGNHALSLQVDGPVYALRVPLKHKILRNYDFNRALGASSALLKRK